MEYCSYSHKPYRMDLKLLRQIITDITSDANKNTVNWKQKRLINLK